MLVLGIVEKVHEDSTIDVKEQDGSVMTNVAVLYAYSQQPPTVYERVAVLVGDGAPLALGSVYSE